MNNIELAPTSTAEDQQLVELVEEITARLQAGEPCDIDVYAARFPEYADRLRDWMAVMSAMADLGHSLAVSAASRAAHPTSSAPQADGSAVGSHAASTLGLLGDFRIVREIGRGGMGVVYEAEQISIGRHVALKVLPFAAMLDKQQLNRFKNEARAAGTLDHPNIVAIHSVGVERGVHYYAMQLIEGQSLAQVVEQLRNSNLPRPLGEGRGEAQVDAAIRAASFDNIDLTRSSLARLAGLTADTAPIAALSTLPDFSSKEYYRSVAQLGIQAAEALDHAHQNGILHRDIKPANLLIDDTGKLWITDFGLARIEQDVGMTMTGDILGTLRYMSPEQALAKRVVVDHRSDIYSLGVTLYELLTLQPAYSASDRQELLHQIAFEDPPKLRQINPHIPTDLETIVHKAIRKDPEHRYATAHLIADDLRSFLDDQPIKAKPPTWHEQLVRWSRRHPAAIWATVLFLLAITLISATSVLLITNAYNREAAQREQANSETAKAQAVLDLLQEMLGSADAARAKGVDYKVRELLDDFAAGLESQLTDQPEIETNIRATIGRAYRSLKLPEKAQPHFEKAIEFQRRVDGPQSEQLAAVLVDGAWNLQDQQRYAEAESQLNQALEIYRGRGVTGGPLFHALEVLQHVLINAGRDWEAERVTAEALAVAQSTGQEFADQANLLHRYAGLKIRQGHFVEAEKLAQQAVEMHRRLHGDEHPETAFGLNALGRALEPQQKLAEAEAAFRESLTIFRRQFPEDHPHIHDAIGKLRAVLEARGDKPALEALVKEEAEIAMRSNNPDYRIRLAGLLLASKPPSGEQKDEARRLIQQAIERYRQIATDAPNDFRSRMNAADGYALALTTYAPVLGFADEVDELRRLLTAELPQLLAAFSDSNQCQWEIAMCYLSWGRALAMSRDYLPKVEYPFSKSVEILEKYSLSDPRRPYLWIWLSNSYAVLGDIQWRLGKPEDAEASLVRAIKICDEHETKIAADIAAEPFPGINLEIVVTHLEHAFLLAASHREDEAAEFVPKATLYANRITHPVELVNAHYYLAIAQLRLGDEASYRATCKTLIDVPAAGVDDHTKWRAIWACCLAHDALDDPSLPVKRAKEFVNNNSLNQHHFALQGLGAALYRASRYEDAAEVLQQSLAAYPSDVSRDYASINYTRLLLAMTVWHQGQHDKARRLLAKTLPDVDKELQTPSLQFHRRATLEVLRREAVTLIAPESADEAVENINRTRKKPKQ